GPSMARLDRCQIEQDPLVSDGAGLELLDEQRAVPGRRPPRDLGHWITDHVLAQASDHGGARAATRLHPRPSPDLASGARWTRGEHEPRGDEGRGSRVGPFALRTR